jgi:hypothetical protein
MWIARLDEILILPSSPFSMTTVFDTISLGSYNNAVAVPVDPPLFAPTLINPDDPDEFSAVTFATTAATPVDGNPA